MNTIPALDPPLQPFWASLQFWEVHLQQRPLGETDSNQRPRPGNEIQNNHIFRRVVWLDWMWAGCTQKFWSQVFRNRDVSWCFRCPNDDPARISNIFSRVLSNLKIKTIDVEIYIWVLIKEAEKTSPHTNTNNKTRTHEVSQRLVHVYAKMQSLEHVPVTADPAWEANGNQSSPWSKLLIQVPHLFWCYRGTQLTPNPSMPCARVMWIWVKRILITPKTDWLISMTNSLGLLLPMLLTFLTHAQRRSRLELLNLDTCYPVAIFWALDHAQWFQA